MVSAGCRESLPTPVRYKAPCQGDLLTPGAPTSFSSLSPDSTHYHTQGLVADSGFPPSPEVRGEDITPYRILSGRGLAIRPVSILLDPGLCPLVPGSSLCCFYPQPGNPRSSGAWALHWLLSPGSHFPCSLCRHPGGPWPQAQLWRQKSSRDSCQNRASWLGKDREGKEKGGLPAIGPHPTGLPPSTNEWSLGWERGCLELR